ncbi:hypothetical protein BN13_800033 [Nostocoides jenkinsii Ben 74]|uniref:Uncharacterized protein n=1 Tax=Nostocoides jenkinsii Ben 74 TaxID=1193518 RepID=A0A077MGS6_9MICO|nr:hypothetical protein BN13_800033 [Tetrasphaera jenkinsii Ben 74]
MAPFRRTESESGTVVMLYYHCEPQVFHACVPQPGTRLPHRVRASGAGHDSGTPGSRCWRGT